MPAKPTKIDSDDLLSKHGSGLLADAINAYWHGRGYRTVKAERYMMVGTKAWGVCSNLVAGLPPLPTRTLAERRAEFLR
jgi:hypothetical protein